MKANRIFYNAAKDEFYPTSLYPHGGIPPFSIDVTEQYQEYRALESQGYTREAGENGLPVYTAPNLTIDTKQVAKQLLAKTHHYETNAYKELLFSSTEYAEFETWRHELLSVIIDDTELPITPDFITTLMETY